MTSNQDNEDHVATMPSLRPIQAQPDHVQGYQVEFIFYAEQPHDIEHIMVPLLL